MILVKETTAKASDCYYLLSNCKSQVHAWSQYRKPWRRSQHPIRFDARGRTFVVQKRNATFDDLVDLA